MKAPERNAGEAHLACNSSGLSALNSSGAPTSRASATILFTHRLVLWRGGCVQVTGVLVPRVDPVGLAEIAYGVNALGDRAAGADCRFTPVQRDEAVELIPPPAREAAVATAWPTAADVLLQQDHLQVGFGLHEVVRGP
jgi:hypothetical protein